MWKIKGPTLKQSLADIPNVVRLAALTAKEEAELRDLYQAYNRKKGLARAEYGKSAIAKTKGDDIHALYKKTIGKGALREIRQDLMKDVNTCPVCGFCDAQTLDHYMPETQFGALAVCRQNLVPMCNVCNTKKNAKPFENFVHMYFAQYPAGVRFLQAVFVISKTSKRTSWRFEIVKGVLDPNLEAQVTYQFDELAKDRVMKQSVTFLHSTLGAYKCTTTAELKILLKNTLESCKDDFGLNHWKTALIEAALNDADFDIDVMIKLLAKRRSKKGLGV